MHVGSLTPAIPGNRPRAALLISLTFLVFLAFTAAASAQPTLSKVFTPNEVGPGSVSTATFTITNGSASPVTGVSFTDNLPAGVTIADPANASTTCDLITGGGTLDAPDGGSTITLTDAALGGFQSCTVTVDVTAPTTAGMYTNPAITLNSDAGSSMSLAVDLTVSVDRPGFSKSFAPDAIDLGDRSTLTFTIDNTANADEMHNLVFVDNLPSGIEVADPANASTDCMSGAYTGGVLNAVPGTSVISLYVSASSFSVAAASSCTVTVEVVGIGTGMLDNVTGELTSLTPASVIHSSGKASDTLAVSAAPLAIQKSFTDDPVAPNGFVTLDFTITNFDRNFSATSVAFSDDLSSALVPPLAGLSVDSLLANDCGDVTASGTLIDLTNGVIAPEGTCTVSVLLAVSGATAGAYVNTSSTVSGMVDGSPVAGNAAMDTLFVDPIPTFTKEFIDDPATGGGTVTLRFTITNTDPTTPLTGIAFTDDIGGTDSVSGRNGALPGLAANSLVDGTGLAPQPLVDPCGAGSMLTIPDPNDTLPSPPFPNLPPDPTLLNFTGGSLAEAGMPGDSCTFDVVLDIPDGTPSGVYTNTTSSLAATPQGTSAASDGLIVVAAPKLTKEFTDDPVIPGGTVTLSFTLSHPAEAIATATAVGFTDDLDAMGIAGLVVNLPPSPDPPCGASSSLTAPGNVLTLQNAELMPGEECTFSVTLDVPAVTTADNYTNTTSLVDAMVAGLAVTSAAVSDTLVVSGLTFTKEFVDDPTIAGDLVTLRFTIENIHPTENATGLAFTDNLTLVLPGSGGSDLAVESPLPTTPCGALSSITGTNTLTFNGGELAANDMCSFDVALRVPVGTADGSYGNITSSLSGTQAGGAVNVSPVVDALTIDSTRIELTKTFTDDPVSPGDFVTMEFTLTNLDPARTASSIAFTDDLNAALTGLTFDSVTNDGCTATINGETTTTIDVADITLGASASCTIMLSLEVPGGAAAGSYENVTSDVTGTISGLDVVGEPASDFLDVIQILGFTKSFDGPSTATGTAILTFTIDNPGTGTASDVVFSDNLNDVIPGLIATGLPALPCGAGSSITGVSLLTFSGGEVAAMDSCAFEVEVLVPADATAGTYPNTTTPLYQNGLEISDVATADLVIEPPPTFMKTFSPEFVGVGLVSTLTFAINNTASAVAASDLDFTDNLPSGLVVAATPNASTTCTGGTLTADAGTGVITYTGGTVAAGASCNVYVDVVTGSTGFFNNTSGDLTSSSGNSGYASDILAVDPPPGFSKSFSPNRIAIDGISTLVFTIDNSLAVSDATDLDFTDNLPAEIVIAATPNATTDCTGGTLTADAGTGVITYTGGTVTTGTSCTVQVDVTSAVVGTHQNTAGHLTSSLGDSGGANANLRVNPPPEFTKAFAPDPTIIGGVVTLTFTIDNTAANVTATNLDFTDPLPAALQVATPANVMGDCNGTVTAVEGSGTISLTGGSVNGQCTISVDVVAVASGDVVNTTGDLTSSLNNSGPAEAMLRVNPPPVFGKAFVPSTIGAGDTGTLVFSVNNTSSTADATALDFTDTLPAEIAVADPANATTDCDGGILTAVEGTDTIAYTGGIVPAGTNCTVSVDITSSTLGMHLNTSGDLTSSLGNSGPADATLTVVDLEPPEVTSVTTSGGALVECAEVRSLISNIGVTITDSRTPIVGADSSAAYFLVGAGADGDFTTADCTGVAGDDVEVTVLGVMVDATDPLSVLASVNVAGAAGLAPGLYRFFVCDTITDTAGNALDGDGDMTAGGVFEVPFFRADPGNRLVNGYFDDCPATLDPWTPVAVSPNAIQTGDVGTDDNVGSPLSASARILQSVADATSFSQCAEVEADVFYDFESWLRYDAPTDAVALFVQTCEYFDATGCTGTSLGDSSVAAVLEDSGGTWTFNESIVHTPIGAVSALCTFETGPLGGNSLFDLYLDGLFFGAGDLGPIFSDGFESGDTSAWSSTVP